MDAPKPLPRLHLDYRVLAALHQLEKKGEPILGKCIAIEAKAHAGDVSRALQRLRGWGYVTHGKYGRNCLLTIKGREWGALMSCVCEKRMKVAIQHASCNGIG